ncbi:Transient receptor potential cation channel subfamily M member 5 [Myotis brandtii]|uniref:Transient receptor potential cation channel subfamily M member 5 n=1 Tax=Myotis brandtii TaxID=109478 RepID=S7Q9F1_MYOBR|nr:Transient receptor potential cation channel subfamily M member 5 [Myotis brandtii]
MMKDVFFFLFFLSVWLVAYGVATQALLHPDDSRLDLVFQAISSADPLPSPRPRLGDGAMTPRQEGGKGPSKARVNCSVHPLLPEGSPACPNLYANWLVILLLVTFLLVTNVLLMNLLIAMFSYTFQMVQGNADMFWRFQRYHLIVEYQERPALAPPFILLSHLGLCPLSLLCHRVEVIAKQLGGLREQEKRIRGLESQVNYCTVLLASVADRLPLGSAHHNSWNLAVGSRQAPAERGGAGGAETTQRPAGPLLSDT